jgi:hypothetical protein
MISPIKRHGDLLQVEPLTEHEKLLQQALRDSEIREAELKGEIRGQQAALVLQNQYCERLRNEIHGVEEKRKKKGNTAMKIKQINQRGRLLTDDNLVALYAQHHAEIEARATEKEKRKADRDKHSEVVKKWKDQEEKRKQKCAEINARYKAEVQAWNDEKELARTEKRRPHWKKPVRGPLPKAAPKPKRDSEEVDDQSGEEFDEESSGSSGA